MLYEVINSSPPAAVTGSPVFEGGKHDGEQGAALDEHGVPVLAGARPQARVEPDPGRHVRQGEGGASAEQPPGPGRYSTTQAA